MLSILIPTYNYNVYPLATAIEQQALKAGIIFEVICIDDGSNSPLNIKNEKINSLLNSKFIAKKQNVGLSNNRNALAELSNYEYILFIDGDSILPDDKFILRYLNAIESKTDVIYGGRIHPETVETTRKLRWKYGKYREDKIADKRKTNIFKCTLFNNTLIKKKVFNSIKFEKSIIQYGHEDTVFAFNLSIIKANILHIDNPVLHGDVDLNETFLLKTQKSLENLNLIYKKKIIDSDFITFLNIFKKIKRFKLNYLFAGTYKILYPFFKLQLTSNNPSIIIFDFFRLSYFCYINLKK
ncbi:MAG: glycosyltransferase [Flavobacteriaceae bacterium]|nr:glycosyltransferase [Flavobacteriaceae bacterium]